MRERRQCARSDTQADMRTFLFQWTPILPHISLQGHSPPCGSRTGGTTASPLSLLLISSRKRRREQRQGNLRRASTTFPHLPIFMTSPPSRSRSQRCASMKRELPSASRIPSTPPPGTIPLPSQRRNSPQRFRSGSPKSTPLQQRSEEHTS